MEQVAESRWNGWQNAVEYAEGLDSDEMEIYGTHFASNNPWFIIPGLMRPGRVLTDLSLEKIHSDRSAFIKIEFCQEWCKKQDFRHAMGGSLLDRQGNLLNFTFFRAQQAGYYTDAEVKRYQTLCRHLMKAVEINARVAALTPDMSNQNSPFDCLRFGVITLDGRGRIAFMNKYAAALLNSKQGICEKELRLKTVNHNCQKLLDHVIDQAFRENKSTTLTLPRPGVSKLSLCVNPK